MNFDSILDHLTPPQREAVTHLNGPMMVIAGAGSGKTRVVTRRIAYLISKGVWPSQILAMTFTNKAAKEMKERVRMLVGEEPRFCGTFHSCCARFLRSDIEALHTKRTRDFTIYDSSEQLSVIKKALKESKLSLPDHLSPTSLGALISKAKGQNRLLIDVLTEENYSNSDIIVQAADLYEQKMQQLNAVDFDDLLLLTVRLLKDNPVLQDIYHNRFRYVLIDEYQDTNHLQYDLMRLLVGPEQNIHVTGDPDQSIYSWRGADYHNIMNFQSDFPGTHIVKLEQNYRSTQVILEAANTLIVQNGNRFDKVLFTENDSGCPVYNVTVGFDYQEAEWICRKMMTLRAEGANLRDMAVFYRTNSQSRLLEESFIRNHVPYQLLGGIRFYERAEIKDLLAFLRLKVNHVDVISLERAISCLHMGIGPATLSKLSVAAERHQIPVVDLIVSSELPTIFGKVSKKLQNLADLMRRLLDIPENPLHDCLSSILDLTKIEDTYQKEPNVDERIENLKEFVSNAFNFQQEHDQASLSDFLQEIALVADVDAYDNQADFITLMTLHSSKGLEFPYVFITGVEQGLLPHINSIDIEEERRLFYVGITRAQKQLVLTHANVRTIWNSKEPRMPSEFLDELPDEIMTSIYYGCRKSSAWRF